MQAVIYIFQKRIIQHSNHRATIMEHEIHVKIGIDHLEKMSPPRAINDNISHRPSLLVSHMKKSSFSRRHRSFAIQVSLFFSIFL